MGIGHLGAGLAAKHFAPKAHLGVLILAAEVLDLLFGVFWALGLEVVPKPGLITWNFWSHGLFMSVVWSVAAGALAWFLTRDRRLSSVIGLVVLSHWVLDFISHPMTGLSEVRDLPLLFTGSPQVGLGLYYSDLTTWMCELGLPLLGLWVYLRTRRRLATLKRAVG